jgi:hypothetical protein
MTLSGKISRIVRLAVVGAAAGAVLVATPGGAAATTTSIERYHEDFGTFVEQATPCTGEPVQWTGGYDIVISTVLGSNTQVRSLQYVQQLNGVGLTSGSSYVLNATYHELGRVGSVGAMIYVFPLVYVEVSKDGQLNYVVHELTQQIIDPSGRVVVESGNAAITCVG